MIRAIETVYHGYRFRSRLEARWAVFFDTLGVPFAYETQGYDLEGLRYLPDFWLLDQQCWFEVKGVEPTEREQEKAQRLSLGSGFPCFIALGDIAPPETWADTGIIAYLPNGTTSTKYLWCECPSCGKVGITLFGFCVLLPCGCIASSLACAKDLLLGEKTTPFSKHWQFQVLQLMHTIDSPRLIDAYTAARQARFEPYHT